MRGESEEPGDPILRSFFVNWVGSILASGIATGIALVITSPMGSARAGPWEITTLGVECVIFIVGFARFMDDLTKATPSFAARFLGFVLHFALQGVTCVVVLYFTVLAFFAGNPVK